VLNIGKLGPGATEYYIGQVATSAEDYYSGRGEHPGRWVGSLAGELGLSGEVEPEHFRRVLQGKHPHTGEFLVASRRGKVASKPHAESEEAPELPERVDSLRAASHLGVSARHVRRLLAEGERYRSRVAAAVDGEQVFTPHGYLLGEKASTNGQAGSDAWTVTRDELERFSASRRRVKLRPGYDLTLRPPKSVSVLWALAEDTRRAEIRRAHGEAVDEVVRYYEMNAVFGRRREGASRRLVVSSGVVAAAFDHRTSRAGDPLLHTHVVTANMTSIDDADGQSRWRAIAGAGLYEHGHAAGFLYQAHLRHLLAMRLGVQFTPVVNGHAEVVGVPDDLIAAFSKRRSEINEVLAESAKGSARSAQVVTLDTRNAKNYSVDAETLEERWRAEAAECGFGAEELSACFGHGPPEPLDPRVLDRLSDTLAGPRGLTERAATFVRTDVIEAISSAVGAAASAPQIERYADRFLSSDHALLVDRAIPVQVSTADAVFERSSVPISVARSATQKMYTTRELVELEEQFLASGTSAEQAGRVLDEVTVDDVIRQRPELSVEQAEMVRATCTAREFVQPIAGRPGAGKTYAIEAVVAAHVVAGVPIVGCAVSAAAASELEHAAGFARSTGAWAMTVARLLWDLRDPQAGGLAPGTVVVVDEASMVGTRDLARLAAHARRAGGAIKLVGDPDQHGSVDVGGVFRRLCVERGDKLVELVDNNRQLDHVERLAIAEYRDGHVADALSRYDEAGKIVRSRTAGESFDAIVADWYAARLCGEVDPMIAGPNSTRRALNYRARVLLKAHGELTGEPLVVGGRELMVGDEVVARRNDRRLQAPGSRDFVKNGSTGTIIEVDTDQGEVIVAFRREGTIRVPQRYLASGYLEHGYARTTYGVQGATHEVARYHPTDVSSFEEGYVALTRARTAARVYIVDGTLTCSADDLTHAPDEPHAIGVNEVAQALARRRSDHMAADASAHLAALADTLNGRTLAQLTRRRRQLDRAMDAAPPDTTRVTDEIRNAIERILARRQAWNDALTEAIAARDGDAVDPTGGAGGDLGLRRTRAAIEALDRAHRHALRRLEYAADQQDARLGWMAEHADLVAEHALVRRAERAREIQIRVAATTSLSATVHDVLGPEPNTQRERLAWRSAVEAIAVYHARYPGAATHEGGTWEQLMGDRPADTRAAAEYANAASAIDAVMLSRSGSMSATADLGTPW
jgi:conjugative relaxase-like TrwC/TraI family protein